MQQQQQYSLQNIHAIESCGKIKTKKKINKKYETNQNETNEMNI